MNIKEDEAKNLDTLLDEIIRNPRKTEFDYRDILFKGESDDFIINLVNKLDYCGIINSANSKQGRSLMPNNEASSFILEGTFKDRYNQALIESKDKEEIKNLEKQNLQLNAEKTTSDIVDQPKLKLWQKLSIALSVIAIILTILEWRC